MATTTTTAVDAHLEMDPDDAIEFFLRPSEATPKVNLTLRHPDPDSAPVAFKVRFFSYCRRSFVFFLRYFGWLENGFLAPGVDASLSCIFCMSHFGRKGSDI